MILLINTCIENKLIFAVKKDGCIFKREIGGSKQAEKIKWELKGFLKKYKLEFNDIKKIIVINGPGRFTSVRIGVSMANALAYAANIPIFGIKLEKGNDVAKIFKSGEKLLKKVKHAKIIMPFYDKEPNITVKNKAVFFNI